MKNPKEALSATKELVAKAKKMAMEPKGIDAVKARYEKIGVSVSQAINTANVDVVNIDNVPKEILAEIKETFRPIDDFIKSYLLNDSNAAFYGMLLIDINSDIDFKQNGFFDLHVGKGQITITFNPFFIEGYTLNEIIGGTLKELECLIQDHVTTFAMLNREKDERKHIDLEVGSSVSSSEQVVSEILLGDKNVRLNKEVYSRSDLEEDLIVKRGLEKRSSLEYYYKISEEYRKKTATPPTGKSQTVIMDKNGNIQDVHDWESIKDIDDSKETIMSKLKETYDSLPEKARGTMPGSLRERLEKMFAPPQLNWRDKFKRYIGSIPSGKRYTPMRFNRRQPERTDLHGTFSDKVVKVVIAIDTSGSMSTNDLEYVFGEIFAMTKAYKTEYTVIECDMGIGKVYKVKKPTDIQLDISGRGGTAFTPVIEYINKDKYFRDAVLVYFTDGYGEYEIPKPRTHRNLWVILGGKTNLSLRDPYGDVESLRNDDKYNKRRR